MYEQHFGFQKRPFSLSPDTRLFVNLPDHERCFQLLIHVLDSGEGFLKVVGDVGTGKTILCRKLLRHLETDAPDRFHSVYIPNPMLSPVGLYRAVGQELGLSNEQKGDTDTLLHRITERILALAESQKGVVIVVDEAQSLPAETLEALRLITNLETEDKKLVQVILFGQTELDDLLAEKRFRQLRQRITFSHYLMPMSRNDIQQYVDYRINQSGYNGPPLFSAAAIKQLYQTTRGVPRMINVLSHKALMAAFADRSRQVEDVHIRRAASDGALPVQRSYAALWALLAAAVMLAGAILWRLL
ncbi:ExeA family protein [Reinekea blandensis]|uniref:Type II secretory pathway, component ExeA (Predicted ATPase) n=1 Tax=Reinekea blandensis MED297 TaxID=314283 RepID=A4BG94_9GAMM|nr:AAA family ATPase [Reinekea blandensis]EAR08889.1 Type II secretory pathway, component ExeA (predicted ATPase) [Reinekea sp. MED297] [Reinekea blandensis MED297]